MAQVQYKKLNVVQAATVSASFYVPIGMKQALVLIPSIADGAVGIEVSMNAGTNYYPVIDNADGADAEVNANTKDPGWTDVTKFLKAFASEKTFLCRFTCAAQNPTVDFHLFFIKGTKI